MTAPTNDRREVLAAEVVALSDVLRKAARDHLGLSDGDYWPSDVADAQARALADDGWLAKHDAEVLRAAAEEIGSEPGLRRWAYDQLRERADRIAGDS